MYYIFFMKTSHTLQLYLMIYKGIVKDDKAQSDRPLVQIRECPLMQLLNSNYSVYIFEIIPYDLLVE
jgi:hypothetical protein